MDLKRYFKKFALILLPMLLATESYSRCAPTYPVKRTSHLTQYVDPFIGSAGHGHVFVGANVPFGMVQLGPTNISTGWDWCSGYHYSDSTILGFGHMHLSGVGTGDLGDIVLMPVTGDVVLQKGIQGNQSSGIYSLFKKNTERVSPGYYAVHLDRYNVDVELTATNRVGFHKYTYLGESASDPRIVFNLEAGIDWDSPLKGYIVQENDSVISGYRYSTGWAKDQRVYFTAVFSEPIARFMVSDSTSIQKGTSLTSEKTYGVAYFKPSAAKKVIYVKVAISAVSIDGAKKNLRTELSGWNFDKVRDRADRDWNKELSKIQIYSPDASIMRTFYTGLYHTMIAPSVFCDVDSCYYGSDQKIHKAKDFVNYTTFSLWDTYRAAHPLMTLIHPERMADIVNTMLNIYKEQGKLPVWHLVGNETNAMVGNPAVPVVADAYLKGFSGFDKDLAYEAMKKSQLLDERGLKEYRKWGFLPNDTMTQSVAKGMEYAIADWALAQVAKKRNARSDYAYFIKRSRSFETYFDKSIGFVRGVDSCGRFDTKPLDPFLSVHQKNDYTEGNAWQYTWLVPHNVGGLVRLFGSEAKFISKLDSLFIVNGSMGPDASIDISGLIGQYAHGNEPSHHIAYLYSFVGQPWKTAAKVREIMTTLYSDKPDGICGNEDVGQMSAWYVLSALGFYQVAPAGGIYVFGSPLINEASITVQHGRVFHINVLNNSAKNKYIRKVYLNRKVYNKSYLRFDDIMAGGNLVLEMGDTPSETFGVKVCDRPETIQ